jgi:threonylcarbamoyladenosine tRNA methylthiotransferase MtaB
MAEIKVAIETLGCKLNQAETEEIERTLDNEGFTIVSAKQSSNIYVLNSCTVTHVADKKGRQAIRRARRLNPSGTIIVTGCYAQQDGHKLRDMPETDLVLGNDLKSTLCYVLAKLFPLRSNGLKLQFSKRNRSYIKIQEGCDGECSFCIVPFVRSRKWSRPAEEIVTEIKRRESEGIKEVVLTGSEIGCYNHCSYDLPALLRQILENTTIPRIRLSSLQPYEITEELLSMWQDKRLCNHFHVSLQSGSDSVLKRMNRNYSTYFFASTIDNIRSAVPDVAITTDIIVGFPGETNNEFKQSFDFCYTMNFARVHVFPYSQRSQTKASGMDNQINEKTKRERLLAMIELGDDSTNHFRSRYLKPDAQVLWEKRNSEFWTGLTTNYLRVTKRSDRNLANIITEYQSCSE